jgi:hypothetical protein
MRVDGADQEAQVAGASPMSTTPRTSVPVQLTGLIAT